MDNQLPKYCSEYKNYDCKKPTKVLMIPLNILYGKGVMCPSCYKKIIVKDKSVHPEGYNFFSP